MQRLAVAIATTIVAISALALTQPLYSASPAQPAQQSSVPPGMEVATFAGGCFWSMEYAFDKAPGVVQTVSGFMGGRLQTRPMHRSRMETPATPKACR